MVVFASEVREGFCWSGIVVTAGWIGYEEEDDIGGVRDDGNSAWMCI